MIARNALETYKKWAPSDALWTEWVKPIMFMNVFECSTQMSLPEITWIDKFEPGTMIIIDLPGEAGLLEGLALVRFGYRPIPLYNSVDRPLGYVSIVKVRDIAGRFIQGANILQQANISKEAPPVFLLDSNRMGSSPFKTPGMYDNRWCVFPQDMPSAEYLIKHNIKKIIVRAKVVENDLSHILKRYQEKEIPVYLCDKPENAPKSIHIGKPSLFKSLIYRYMTIAGLSRNTAGGFGGLIPEPAASNGRMG